jgi:hypothetical protein
LNRRSKLRGIQKANKISDVITNTLIFPRVPNLRTPWQILKEPSSPWCMTVTSPNAMPHDLADRGWKIENLFFIDGLIC